MRLTLSFAWLLTAILGCGSEQHRIQYILPDGYRGPFYLILDHNMGIDPEEQNGLFTYLIPENGVLRISSFQPFRRRHTVSASFSGRTIIPAATSRTDDKQVAVRSLAEINTGEFPPIIVVVIGTKSDQERVRKELISSTLDFLRENGK